MKRKAVSGIMLALFLIGMFTLAFNIQPVKASNAASPYIAVVPESTVNPALTPGMNYTISIMTDYNGSDVWGYEFKLTYNPLVLEGIEVVNGDLITEDVGTTMWKPGSFNNTLGELELTGNGFFFLDPPPPVTSGPGIMANITFSVVGYGDSYISLGDETRLIGYDDIMKNYNIIDKYYPDTGHILDGYFANQLEVTHDIAVISVTPSPTEVEHGELLNVTVVVENQGTVDEDVTVEIYRDHEPGVTFWLIGEKSVNLAAGATKSLVFVWDTTDAPPGEHTVTAVAIELPGEDDVADNILESDRIVGVRGYAWTETIYIRADGSVEPDTAPISTVDNITYTLRASIVGDVPYESSAIVVERDNIVIDGAGYALQGTGWGNGISLTGRINVTIRNIQIKAFYYGIYLDQSSNNTIYGNNLTKGGIYVGGWDANNNVISGNNIANNRDGNRDSIVLDVCSNTVVSGNNIVNSDGGITLWNYPENSIICENNLINNTDGLYVGSCSGNTVVYHNNFINNTNQVTYHPFGLPVFDNGYPSGGNYWSNYTGADSDHDGIGDTPHEIDADNVDNYPLMGMFSDFNATSEYHVQTICNSSISDFQFNGTAICFNVSGEDGTTGFCRICIPRALVNETYKAFVNGTEVAHTLLPCSNSTHSYLYLTYDHSTQEVVIVPEFPIWTSTLLALIVLTIAIATHKRRLPKTPIR